MSYVKHPLIRKGKIESRLYQESILNTTVQKNTLCVLPTGLGKTNIAVMLAANRLQKFPDSKVLVLAPTRPLVNQHYKTFMQTMNLDEAEFAAVMGTVKPELREKSYNQSRLIFSTPQTIQNDIEGGRLGLKDFSLLVVDETHHSVGRYAYPYVVQRYREMGRNQRILGLTASPGATREKIKEICKNTGVETVEIRTETDSDVGPYIQEKRIEWENVELPPDLRKIRKLVQGVYDSRLNSLRKLGYLRAGLVSKRELLDLQKKLFAGVRSGYKKAILGMSFLTQAIKLEHALTLLETQGITVLEGYWKKLREGKSGSDKRVASNREISNAMHLTHELFLSGRIHPKLEKLKEIVSGQLKQDPDSRIIVFANYRESVKEIVKALEGLDSVKPVEFVGQKQGMTQKEQLRRLNSFREGEYNVLVGTSISEEGLDIVSSKLAVFFEPVASPLRSIQRRGRVGRLTPGKIIVLITKGTRDEAYHWVSFRKEKRMKGIVFGMRGGEDRKPLKRQERQKDLRSFA